MRYVLDTNIVSALLRGAPTVAARLQDARVADVLIPQPVLAELLAGVELLPRSRRERQLRKDLEGVASMFPRSPWTDETSHAFARIKARLLKAGAPLEDFDVAIAAHALAESATLATDNVRHFERIAGLQVENWLDDD